MDQLLRTGGVRYAYIGIRTEDLTPAVAKKFGYAAKRGALVDIVNAGSAADRAGLRAGTRAVVYEGLVVKVGGDAIVAIDGIPVGGAQDVVRIVTTKLVPGESVRFTVVRGRQRRTVNVTLDQRPAPR
jgi:2-alkenal reductase